MSNASELYFFKLLMKADTNIGFGEEIVVLDGREDPAFKNPAGVPEGTSEKVVPVPEDVTDLSDDEFPEGDGEQA